MNKLANDLFKTRKSATSQSVVDPRKRSAFEMLKTNSDKMSPATEPKPKKAAREKTVAENDVFEIPATQISPPRAARQLALDRANSAAKSPAANLILKRLQKQDRQPMSSSPSMMKSKPVESEQRKQPKTADAIFEELKNSEPASQSVTKVADKPSEKLDASTSPDEKEQVKAEKQTPAKAPSAVESRDWSKIKPETLRAHQESVQSLLKVMGELKKANDKISEFRKVIAKKF